MTDTEKITFELCKETFLSFWSFPNPIGKKNKELCDILVVCSPDIIIFSVKDININKTGNNKLDQKRWNRAAIKESSNQIYGAERFISENNYILLKDKTSKIDLPPKEIRNIYRVAVAFGRGEEFSLEFGDFKKGFIHVFDEQSVRIVINELDTITDFIEFLKAKEIFVKSEVKHTFGSEEDYLTLFLQNGFDNLENATLLLTTGNIWEGFSTSLEYKEMKKENETSYNWDRIIELFHHDFENETLSGTNSLSDVELCLRHMSRESRFARRELSKSFIEVIQDSKLIARSVKSGTNNLIGYVFLAVDYEDRERLIDELYTRCFIIRSHFEKGSKIIGIGTNKTNRKKGAHYDLCYLDIPNWDEQLEAQAKDLQLKSGFFNPTDA